MLFYTSSDLHSLTRKEIQQLCKREDVARWRKIKGNAKTADMISQLLEFFSLDNTSSMVVPQMEPVMSTQTDHHTPSNTAPTITSASIISLPILGESESSCVSIDSVPRMLATNPTSGISTVITSHTIDQNNQTMNETDAEIIFNTPLNITANYGYDEGENNTQEQQKPVETGAINAVPTQRATSSAATSKAEQKNQKKHTPPVKVSSRVSASTKHFHSGAVTPSSKATQTHKRLHSAPVMSSSSSKGSSSTIKFQPNNSIKQKKRKAADAIITTPSTKASNKRMVPVSSTIKAAANRSQTLKRRHEATTTVPVVSLAENKSNTSMKPTTGGKRIRSNIKQTEGSQNKKQKTTTASKGEDTGCASSSEAAYQSVMAELDARVARNNSILTNQPKSTQPLSSSSSGVSTVLSDISNTSTSIPVRSTTMKSKTSGKHKS